MFPALVSKPCRGLDLTLPAEELPRNSRYVRAAKVIIISTTPRSQLECRVRADEIVDRYALWGRRQRTARLRELQEAGVTNSISI